MKKIVKYFESVLLWIVCCIPVVTIAASTTAMHFAGLKLAEGEDISVHKEFFKSFKQNFKASLPMLVIVLIASGVLGVTWYLQFATDKINEWAIAFLLLPTIYYLMFEQLLLYILAKFDNDTKRTIMLAIYMGVRQIDKAAKLALIAIAVIAIPIIIYVVAPSVTSILIAVVVFIVLVTFLQMISSHTVTKIFTFYIKEQERNQQERENEEAKEKESSLEEQEENND